MIGWVLIVLITNGAGKAVRVDHVAFNNKRNCLEALKLVDRGEGRARCLRR